MNTPTSINEALAFVTKRLCEIGIAKLRRNEAQSFNFRGIDDIHNVLSPVLVEAGLMVIPSYDQRTFEARTTAKGSAIYFVSVKGMYCIRYVGPGGEQQHISAGPFYGEAMDSADKATAKAMSVAYKYFAVQTFCIPVEGTPDADADAEVPLTDPQQAALVKLREAALEGTGALETAWKEAGKDTRLALAGHLQALKEAAALADGGK